MLAMESEAGDPIRAPGPAGRVCGVCTQRERKYQCPRCGVPYCSVDCYKAHDATCCESFYQVRAGTHTNTKNNMTKNKDQKK